MEQQINIYINGQEHKYIQPGAAGAAFEQGGYSIYFTKDLSENLLISKKIKSQHFVSSLVKFNNILNI